MANTKVTGDLIASSTIATGNIADNAVTSDKISGITTAHITEGSNLYYTDARARSAVSVSGNALTYNSSTGVITSNFEESPTFTGAVVGSSFSAAAGFLNGSNGGIRIHSSGTKFFNITAANAARDNIMDIGASDARFKDLYLGGNIQAAGNVGIGTTSPAYKLDVDGSVALNVMPGHQSEGSIHIGRYDGNTTRYNLIKNYVSSTQASNYMKFALHNGTEGATLDVMTLLGSGNVGIGTASPNEKIQVAGNIHAYAPSGIDAGLFASTAAGSTTMAIRSSGITHFNGGNVGIGTTSPAYKLDIAGTSPRIRVQETSSNTAVTQIEVENSNGRGAMLGIGGSGRTDILTNRGYINAQAATDGLAIGTESTDPIIFYTQGLSASNEKMRINSSGNVGIGTFTPNKKLTVYGGNDNGIWVDSSGSRYTSVAWGNMGSEKANIAYDNTNSNFALTAYGASNTIFTNNSSERMRITSAGKVGINTTSPEAKLTVFGGVAGGTHTHAVFTGTAGRGIALKSGQTGGQHNGKAIIDAQDTEAGGASMDLQIGGSTKLAIDNSGSIGIGVVPFAHSLGTSVTVDLLGNGGIWGYAGATYVNSNAYYNSGWKYKSNGIAAALQVGGSSQVLTFRQAASGTAGSAVTYTEAFRVHTNGNVGIGTSSPDFELDVAGSIGIDDYIYHNGDHNTYIRAQGDQWTFRTGGDDRMHINNTGVGIGTTTPQTKLQVNGTVSSFNAHFGPGQNNGAGNFGGISLGYAENANALYRKVGIVAQTKGDNSARQDLHFLVDTVNDQNSAGIADSKMHIQYNTGDVIIDNSLGIGTTSPDGRLDVRGAISSGMALEDADVSLTSHGATAQATGTLEISQGWSSSTSSGDTIVFRHNSTSWKAWILHYNFASTNGVTIGVIGGYWNNSGSSSNNFIENNLGASVAVTHGGTGNQNIIVTFTFTSLGTHPLSSFKYIQSGGDGKPLASKTSITLNS